jgi:hypothetical protein
MAVDIGHARFDTPTMFRLVGADDLDLQHGHAHLFANGAPSVARERPWIHAVDDNSKTNAQVVGSHRMGNGVPLSLHDHGSLPERLLDRIDAQVDGSKRTR